MSLYGALFAGVSGLNAQGSAIAALGDNISNLNTVGYKGASINFSTLVTNSGAASSYSSGGVASGTRRLIDEQGLIQATGVISDLAISGEGFFVVNTKPDASGETFYTRAGSFRKDNRGNYVNSAGFNLMAWPLDNEQRLPGQVGNLNTTSNALLDSLVPVNVKSVSGVASATTKADVGLNLDASQSLLEGAGDTLEIPATAGDNVGVSASSVLVPEAAPNPLNLAQGNTLTFSPSSPGTAYTFSYGGVVNSDDVTVNNMYNATTPSTVFSVLPAAGGATAGSSFTISTTSIGDVTFTLAPSSPNVTLGQFNSMNTLADAINQVPGITARVVNNKLYIAPTDGTDAITFTDVVGSFSTVLGGNIAAGTAPLPNRFSTLQGLADLINGSAGLEARLINPLGTATMDIFATDPLGTLNITASRISTLDNDAMSTGAIASNVVTVTHPGHGLSTGEYVNISGVVSPFDGVTVADGNYIVTVVDSDHYTIVASAGVAAGGNTPGGGSTIVENGGLANDPFTTTATSTTVVVNHPNHGLTDQESVTLDGTVVTDFPTLTTLDGSYIITYIDADSYSITVTEAAVAGMADGGALVEADAGVRVLNEFGLGITGMPPTAAVLGPAYDPTDGTTIPNMASGDITPQFSRNVRFFDAIGTGHDFQVSFVKLADNVWGTEIYAIDPEEIVSSRTDGQVAAGTIIFNGDGSLRSVGQSITNPIEIQWANKAVPSEITFNWGTPGQIAGTEGATTIGKTDGLRQFNSAYDVQFMDQNGVAPGLLTGINIDDQGFIVANFSNGEVRELFKIPLAQFANPNGLEAIAGNIYRESQTSGSFNLKEPGASGAGKVTAAALEQANVELADELTKTLIAQRGYQACSKIIKTADDLLDELNRVFS